MFHMHKFQSEQEGFPQGKSSRLVGRHFPAGAWKEPRRRNTRWGGDPRLPQSQRTWGSGQVGSPSVDGWELSKGQTVQLRGKVRGDSRTSHRKQSLGREPESHGQSSEERPDRDMWDRTSRLL